MVSREPIVRENGIRFLRSGRIIVNVNSDPGRSQCLDHAIEFELCLRRNDLRGLLDRFLLESVIERRLRVWVKPARPDHDDGVGALFRHLILRKPNESRLDESTGQRRGAGRSANKF